MTGVSFRGLFVFELVFQLDDDAEHIWMFKLTKQRLKLVKHKALQCIYCVL